MNIKEATDIQNDLDAFKKEYSNHKHLGTDKTQQLDSSLNLSNRASINIGGKFSTSASITSPNLSSTQDIFVNALDVTIDDPVRSFARNGVQISCVNTPNDGSHAAFFYGVNSPFVLGGIGSIVQGGSVLTDPTAGYITNELVNTVGGVLDVNYLEIFNSDGSILETHPIVANTGTTITIGAGTTINYGSTWAAPTAGTYNYYVSNTTYLGTADWPWRRLYTNQIRFNEGSSSGPTVQWIKTGSGSPEGSVTGNPGSLYLNLSGGAGTSLYIKESGSPMTNTGWTGAGGGSSSQAYCRAHQSSGQSISDVTNTKINIDTADIAASGITFDTTNKRFTATASGNYLVIGSLVFSDTTDQKLYFLKLYKNGSQVTTAGVYAPLSGSNLSQTTEIHDIITLAATDYVELWTFHNSGATEIATGGVMGITRIS